MTRKEHFEHFKRSYWNEKTQKTMRPFRDRYGDISLEDGFAIQMKNVDLIMSRKDKIKRFEDFLVSQGAKMERSQKSESKYYYYKGQKFRFSAHVYPTGSMTNKELGIYDFAANPELIDSIVSSDEPDLLDLALSFLK